MLKSILAAFEGLVQAWKMWRIDRAAKKLKDKRKKKLEILEDYDSEQWPSDPK